MFTSSLRFSPAQTTLSGRHVLQAVKWITGCDVVYSTESQHSVAATCLNDLGFVDYELLITVQSSFNQSFLLSPATGTSENWLMVFPTGLSHLWPCFHPRQNKRLSSARLRHSLSVLLHEAWGHCWHHCGVLNQMHCSFGRFFDDWDWDGDGFTTKTFWGGEFVTTASCAMVTLIKSRYCVAE